MNLRIDDPNPRDATGGATDPVGDDRAGRERRTPSRTTVLVVEDDAALLELARRQLEAQSFEVAAADSAESGIEQYLAAVPDLVLLDLALPDRSGFDVCETIRSLPGGASIPIIIMTGMGDTETIARAYRSGASDFAVKPSNWTVLGNRIRLLIDASQTRQHLASSRSKLETAESTAHLGTWEYDLIQERLIASDETWRILGLTPEGSTELNALLDSVHPLDKTAAVATFELMASELAEIDLEHRLIWPDGSVRTVHHRAQVRRNQAGHAVSVQGVLQDVSDLRRAEQRIRHLANYDRLTGLPNRHMFVEFLEGCAARTQRRGGMAAVVHIDIDRFKKINETLGPEVGDEVLVSIADRLRFSLRKGDLLVREDGPAVARWGGDRFLVLLSGIDEIADAARAVQRLLRQLAIPFAVANSECFLTAGAGIAVYPSDGESAYELLQHAESASHYAKQLGRDRLQFYSQWMNESSARNLDLENDLHKAILQHQFHLAYQPILDVRCSKVAGAEALLRWSHPELGPVSPSEFIPIAESAGLMPSIGEWVLRGACRQLRSWLDEGMAAIRLSVNLSSYQLLESGFVDKVERILEDARLDPRLLEIELTERGLKLEDDSSIQVVKDLRALGLRVAVDDFGVGNSALSYLRSFPLDTLKIDQSFIRGIENGSSDSAIISAVIMMAHRLNLEVVAEGVEEQGQLEFLASQACDRAQGFLFARPLPPAQFVEAFDRLGGLPRDCSTSKMTQ